MENASKALIIAGGVLISILVVSLFIFAINKMSEYRASNEELANIENISKFNEQFLQYNKQDVMGYDILSLINKIRDYNFRKSSASNAKNDEKYTPISITISFENDDNLKELTQDNNIRLFTNNTSLNLVDLETIIDISEDIEEEYGGSTSATKLAKSINSIFLNESTATDNDWQKAMSIFNKYSTRRKVYNKHDLLNEQENIYKYYEFMQFKRCQFDSDGTQIQYDPQTNRIINMKFNYKTIY